MSSTSQMDPDRELQAMMRREKPGQWVQHRFTAQRIRMEILESKVDLLTSQYAELRQLVRAFEEQAQLIGAREDRQR